MATTPEVRKAPGPETTIFPRYPAIVLESAQRYREYLTTKRGQFSAPVQPAIQRLIDLLGRVPNDGVIESDGPGFVAAELRPTPSSEVPMLVNQWSLGWGRDSAPVVVMGSEEAYLPTAEDLGQWNSCCAVFWATGGRREIVEAIDPRLGNPPKPPLQAIIATNQHVLIIKLNLGASSSKGHHSWTYNEIVSVQVRTSFGSGVIEIGSTAEPVKGIGFMQAQGSSNAISFGGKDDVKFKEMETLIADQVTEAELHRPASAVISLAEAPIPQDLALLNSGLADTTNQPPAELSKDHTAGLSPVLPGQSDDIPAKLKQLGELYQAGILTPEEFAAKKAELLARL